MSNQLYALSGQFETPDEIMHAAEEVNKKYKQYDVNTPYPVHGMDGAMGMGESPIGWVTLIVGTTCMLLMLCFIAWIQLVDYPTTFAGKPDFNLPGYVPILFETTILTGAVTTVLTLLFVVCGLPNNAHPIHDTNYAKRTSDDRFGIYVEAKDPAFGLEAVWIDASQRDQAQSLGYTVVDASTVVATHLNQILYKHCHELIGHEEVQQLLQVLAKASPKLAEELVPGVISLSGLLKVLQALLSEQVPVRDIRSIAEAIANNAPLSVRQIKKSVRYGGQMELRTAFRFEIEAYNHLIGTEDRMEGIAAFNEKRKANFKGC